jgi:predicted transcriptional regulator
MKSKMKLAKMLIERSYVDHRTLDSLNFNPSTIYRAVSSLKKLGVVEADKDGIRISQSPKAKIIFKIFKDYNIKKIFDEKFLSFIKTLNKPLEIEKIARVLDLSSRTVLNYAKILWNRGLIEKTGRKYFLKGEAKKLAEILSLEEETIDKKIYWKLGEETLFTSDLPQEASLTAFSLFSSYDVRVFPETKYYFSPKKELSLEEIFVHSLVFSDSTSKWILSLIFFMKHRDKLSVIEIERLVKKFEVRKKWEKVVKFLKNEDIGIEKQEIEEKLSEYGLKSYRWFASKESILALFEKIDDALEKEVETFLIGGVAMVMKNLKPSTKDIDVILRKRDSKHLFNTLIKLDFKRSDNSFEKKGVKIDVFVERVLGGFYLSKEMMENSTLFFSGRKLKVFVLSNECIFLFKSLTDRKRDLDDCEILARKGLDWDFILEETLKQESLTKRYFSFALLDAVTFLEESGMKIPIKRKLDSHCLKIAILLSLKKPISFSDLVKKIERPESTVRRALMKLLKEGLVRRKKLGKVFVYFTRRS